MPPFPLKHIAELVNLRSLERPKVQPLQSPFLSDHPVVVKVHEGPREVPPGQRGEEHEERHGHHRVEKDGRLEGVMYV